MIEPTQEKIYRLCGIEQPGWAVDRMTQEQDRNVGRETEPSGAQVALRWIGLLDGRPYTRTSDGPYDVYAAEGSRLRVKVG